MVHLYRLIVGALLLALSSSAFALLPLTQKAQFNYLSKLGDTAPKACEAYWLSIGGTMGKTGDPSAEITESGETGCRVQFYSKGNPGGLQFWTTVKTVVNSCPANASPFQDACKCNSGYHEDGGACVPDKVCPSLGSSADGPVMASGGASYTGGPLCNDGCVLYPTTAGQFDGVWYAWGPWTSAGVNCEGGNGGGVGTTQQPPQQCPVGQCPGEVNGVSLCVPCGTTTNTNTSGSTSTTSTSAGTSTNATTTKTDVQCSGDKCTVTKTTTTTSTGSGGGAPTTSTSVDKKEVPKETFCTENPKSPLCKDGSFAGACGAGFQCDGDAIQCAVAREMHVRNCALFDSTSDESTLYGSEKNKTGVQTGAVQGLSIGPGSFDTSDAIGGGSCITDRTVTVAGASVSLPFSLVCGQLAMLGNVLLAVSFLLAARIVTRG